jgi:hypothetical protein
VITSRVLNRTHRLQVLDGHELADRAHMSPSTFRQHFRALTGPRIRGAADWGDRYCAATRVDAQRDRTPTAPPRNSVQGATASLAFTASLHPPLQR